MESGTTFSSFFRPEVAKTVILLSATFWLTATSALEAEERSHEVTTEGFEFPTYETTANVTESPDDNGMAIGDIPREINPTIPPPAPQSKEEEPSAVEQQPVLVSFPDNHKNFTPSQYLGDQDFPPYYNHLNTYQQQYKNYYEQKKIFSRKPIKFEENSLKNYYLPQTPKPLDFTADQKTENGLLRLSRNPNPFPYAFDLEHSWPKATGHAQEQPHGNGKSPQEWYKSPGHQKETSYKVNEDTPEEWYKHNDHVFRGHQESPLPYYAFPHTYPQEDKVYHNEVLHLDHHHVKKDEKGNPWKKVFHVLTALVPFGLLLASLTPNVISINSTATTKTTRQRSEDAPSLRFKEEDVVNLMKKYGVESLSEGQCEDRIICELATEGGKTSAGPVEKGFWFLANQTPWDIAEKAGMNDLFKAIKTGNCDIYKCHGKAKPSSNAVQGKKFTWKHKIAKRPSSQQ